MSAKRQSWFPDANFHLSHLLPRTRMMIFRPQPAAKVCVHIILKSTANRANPHADGFEPQTAPAKMSNGATGKTNPGRMAMAANKYIGCARHQFKTGSFIDIAQPIHPKCHAVMKMAIPISKMPMRSANCDWVMITRAIGSWNRSRFKEFFLRFLF